MEKKDNTPLWVSLGISSVKTRKGAMTLFWSTFVCGVAFMPWAAIVPSLAFIPEPVKLTNWDWAWPTFLIAAWYWLCIRWVDKNSSWQTPS